MNAAEIDRNLVKHVVVLVHGIRTFGAWQDRACVYLKRTPGYLGRPIRYGYFDLVRFLLPIPAIRRRVADKVEDDMRQIQKAHPDAKISVVAHSFGAFLVSDLLLRPAPLPLEALIMAGAVVRDDYPWHLVRHLVAKGVRNDHSFRDGWPAIGKNATVGYGAIGTFGANNPVVHDVRHKSGHSGYFTEESFGSWRQFIESGDVTQESTEFPGKGWASWWGQVALAAVCTVKLITPCALLIMATLLLHPKLWPLPLAGMWHGQIAWNADFAGELFGPGVSVESPNSKGQVLVDYDPTSDRWQGLSVWTLRMGDTEYAKLAVEPVFFDVDSSEGTAEFKMEAIWRAKVVEFPYKLQTTYHMKVKLVSPDRLEGTMHVGGVHKRVVGSVWLIR